MHEYGIVQNLLLQVDEQVRAHVGRRAIRVVLAIEGGHVDEGFLRDAFDVFKLETTARDAELLVTQAPTELWCPECGAYTAVAEGDTACPRCESAGVRLDSTAEIYLESVEIEV